MTAEVDVEVAHRAALRRDLLLLAAEDRHVRPAETVDGLLGVAHGAEFAPVRAAEQAHELHLLLSGVLELVHHDHLEAAGKLRAHRRIVFECVVGEREQVVVVEHPALALERSVLALDLGGERDELVKRLATRREIGVGEEEHALGAHVGHGILLVLTHAARPEVQRAARRKARAL